MIFFFFTSSPQLCLKQFELSLFSSTYSRGHTKHVCAHTHTELLPSPRQRRAWSDCRWGGRHRSGVTGWVVRVSRARCGAGVPGQEPVALASTLAPSHDPGEPPVGPPIAVYGCRSAPTPPPPSLCVTTHPGEKKLTGSNLKRTLVYSVSSPSYCVLLISPIKKKKIQDLINLRVFNPWLHKTTVTSQTGDRTMPSPLPDWDFS